MNKTPLLPPRKRDWKSGTYQVGLFIRFPNGSVIEYTVNAANQEETNAAAAFLKLLTKK